MDFLRLLGRTFRDLLPIICVVAGFQIIVVRAPLPGMADILLGVLFVLFGLTFIVKGLEMSIFPLGRNLADMLARRGNVVLLLAFAFFIGFGSTVAEPALAAVAANAARAASDAGIIGDGQDAIARYAWMLRYGSAAAVGLGLVVGVFRLLKGWPVIWFILAGYAFATFLLLVRPSAMGGIAMDAGAAATSVVNIPLITALGLGLASLLRERSPLVDGFGLVAFASLMPMLTILTADFAMGMVDI